MILTLHPNLAVSLNAQGERMFQGFGLKTAHPDYETTFAPNTEPHQVVQVADDDDIWWGRSDEDGEPVARYVTLNCDWYGVEGENHQSLLTVRDRLCASKELRDVVSKETVEKSIMKWMKDRVRGLTTASLTDYVLQALGEKVDHLEVWVPVAHTYIEAELPLGNVIFKTITREMIDQWNAEIVPRAGRPVFNSATEHTLIGLAAATLVTFAEPEKAAEIATAEAEIAVAALRFFMPDNWSPTSRSYCVPLGRENAERSFFFSVDRHGMFRHAADGFVDRSKGRYMVSNELVELVKSHWDFDTVSTFIRVKNKTPFQQALLESWILYSKHTTAPSLTEKVVYLFAALESLLLKDGSEGILAGVPERMAFLSTDNGVERLAIVDRFKEAYKYRSLIIHHGQVTVDAKMKHALKGLLSDVFLFYRMLFRTHDAYASRNDLFRAIDTLKFGA